MIKNIKKIYIRYAEVINYLIFGVLTTIVSLVTYYLCVFTFLNPENAFELQLANILSWIFAVIFAYLTNRKYVFKSNEKDKLKEGIKFFTSRLLTLGIDMFVMFLGVTILNLNNKIIKLVSQILVIVGNYVFSRLFVFKKTDNN